MKTDKFGNKRIFNGELNPTYQGEKKVLEKEELGCPYFFGKCHVKIDARIFNEYCLDNYKPCNFYIMFKREDKYKKS